MTYGKMTTSSIISCNTSYERTITPEVLIGILSGKLTPMDWLWHMDTFFNELPDVYIEGVVQENNLSIVDMYKAFKTLPTPLQSKKFESWVNHVRTMGNFI